MAQDKSVQLAHHLHHLEEMLELASDPKLLWEEMQILGKKAFNLQEKMENGLNYRKFPLFKRSLRPAKKCGIL